MTKALGRGGKSDRKRRQRREGRGAIKKIIKKIISSINYYFEIVGLMFIDLNTKAQEGRREREKKERQREGRYETSNLNNQRNRMGDEK